MSFTLGSNTAKTTPGFTLGSPSVTTATPGAGGDVKTSLLSFPSQTSQAKTTGTVAPLSFTTQGTGFSLGQTQSTPSTQPTGFTFGQSSGFTLGQTPTQTTAIPLGSTPAATTSSGFNLNTTQFSLTPLSTTSAVPASQTVTPILQTATPAATAASATTATPLFFGTSATTTSSSLKLGLQTPAVTSSTTSITTSVTSAPPALTTTVSSTAVPTQLAAINYNQLQENINKWKIVLEEQEQLFINQAGQVNEWDRCLINNSEKIVSLNNEVLGMKLQQQQLDNELEFILSQQGELEECLTSLEKDLATMPANVDPERENIYAKAESMDTQLKQMSEDLKEIIGQLNESNRSLDTSDPIVQIGRILNAHMNSLQWIDQNTVNIQTQLDSVTKLHDLHRRDSERSFRLTYD